MTKADTIKRWAEKADQAEIDGAIYSVVGLPDGLLLDPLDDNERIHINNELLEKGTFDEETLRIEVPDGFNWKLLYITFQKVSNLKPPTELLSFSQLENLFEEIADEADGKVYEGYSGRFMYGKQCWGVSGDDASKILQAASERGLAGHRQDNLGLQTIVYWPNIEYKEEEQEEEQEGEKQG